MTEDVLLGIARPLRLDAAAKARHATSRRGAHDSRIERHQILGQPSAAGVACAADPIRVDVVSRTEVVERPHSVPDTIGRGVASHGNAAGSDQRVFGRRPVARYAREVQNLIPLALTDGVIAERGDAMLGQKDTRLLVTDLPVGRVATRHEHCRNLLPRPLVRRQIEQGGNEVPWLALKDDFLDAVAAAFN